MKDRNYDFDQIFYGTNGTITSSYSLLNKSGEQDSSDSSDSFDSSSSSGSPDISSWEQLLAQGAEALKLADQELKKSRFVRKLVSTHKIWAYGKTMKERYKQTKMRVKMSERKEQLKKRENLFIDAFGYTPFGGDPIQTYQVSSLPSLPKELEGRLLENFGHEEEDGQINSLVKQPKYNESLTNQADSRVPAAGTLLRRYSVNSYEDFEIVHENEIF
jgi:hypothetical protein